MATDGSAVQQRFIQLNAMMMVRHHDRRTEGQVFWLNEDGGGVSFAQAEAALADLHHDGPSRSHDPNVDARGESQFSQTGGKQARTSNFENSRFLAPGQIGKGARARGRGGGDGRSRSQSGQKTHNRHTWFECPTLFDWPISCLVSQTNDLYTQDTLFLSGVNRKIHNIIQHKPLQLPTVTLEHLSIPEIWS